jgi:hypothetical protein
MVAMSQDSPLVIVFLRKYPTAPTIRNLVKPAGSPTFGQKRPRCAADALPRVYLPIFLVRVPTLDGIGRAGQPQQETNELARLTGK